MEKLKKKDFHLFLAFLGMSIFAADNFNRRSMSYSQIAQMELMNAINSINSELELKEFRDMLAHYFAKKATP